MEASAAPRLRAFSELADVVRDVDEILARHGDNDGASTSLSELSFAAAAGDSQARKELRRRAGLE